MSAASTSIDPILLAEFVDESLEMLSSVDGLFVELEAAPTNLDLVQSIFRPVHSIKGNSAFFGCNKVKTLAHELENILDFMRKGKMAVKRDVVSILLEGLDELGHMLRRARAGEDEVIDEPRFNAMVERAKSACADATSPVEAVAVVQKALAVLEDVYAEVVASESPWHVKMEVALNQLRTIKKAVQSVDAALGDAPPAAQAILRIVEHPFEGQLDAALARTVGENIKKLAEIAGDDEQKAILTELTDTFDTFVATVGFDSLVRDVVLEKVTALVGRGKWIGLADESPTAAVQPAPSSEHEKSIGHVDAQKTMRVSEAHIDTFLAYVGELLVLGDMFTYLQARLAGVQHSGNVAADFRRANESFATLSNNLQNSIMSIRKVPLRVLLQKVPRLVRDVTTGNGKEIRVEVLGDDVEIDKSLLEVLDAPLTHMVRNAADHGIESPDEREAVGKERQGLVRVSAHESSTDIILTIEDDGKGIDRDALRVKAESLGMIAPGAPLTQDDIIALLFRSGVSTAKTVTDVSGRGVGMDVVRSNVEGAGGRIAIETESGKGSTFAVHLPKSVTTQIINGFVVYCDSQPFVLPLDRVLETMQVGSSQIESIVGKGRCVIRHDEMLTVVSLHDALNSRRLEGGVREGETLVAVQGQRGRYAIIVDTVLGVRKLVLKTIHGLQTCASFVTGAALMGDGTIALVLDLEDLLKAGTARTSIARNGKPARRQAISA